LDTTEILEILKELTLDLVAGKRQRAETVIELHRRINANLVYDMDEKEPQRELITQVYVSLENLIAEDFTPSPAEIKYFAECFEGTRDFKLSEVREFEVVSSGIAEPTHKPQRSYEGRFKKPAEKKIFPGNRNSGKINR
jgi:hypothetical protein